MKVWAAFVIVWLGFIFFSAFTIKLFVSWLTDAGCF